MMGVTKFRDTVMSPDGKYRYRLFRDIHGLFSGEPCVFVMLNPSTADARVNDPTINRCMAFARTWGYDELFVVNLFAVRGSKPSIIREVSDPVGPENVDHVRALAQYAKAHDGAVVCAWGAHGGYMDQDRTVLGWLDAEAVDPLCLNVTKDGFPSHPLYLRGDAKPVPYNTGRAA